MSLPLPPSGKQNWPWISDIPAWPSAMPDGSSWPRLSIITPSFNQAAFLEETIRSVLLQGYPSLEYLIIDGGSQDGSVEIIQKYSPWLAYWTSECDTGQANAINKGLQLASGELFAWINSDDLLAPNAWRESILALLSSRARAVVYRDCQYINAQGAVVDTWYTRQLQPADLLLGENYIPQPTVIMHTAAVRQAGGLDESLSCILDYELWVRLSFNNELFYLPGSNACFRLQDASKTLSDQPKFFAEQFRWLENAPYLAGADTLEQRKETERRLHIKAAMAALFAGDAAEAQSHFRLALQDGCWPYGELDVLATRLANARSHQERLENTFPDRAAILKLALAGAGRDGMGKQLYHRVVAANQVDRLFRAHPADPQLVRRCFRQAIRHDPRWLRNRGVLSLAAQAYFGERVAGWLRRLV